MQELRTHQTWQYAMAHLSNVILQDELENSYGAQAPMAPLLITIHNIVTAGLPVVTSYPSLSTISSISLGRGLSFHDLNGYGILPPKTKNKTLNS